MVLSIEATFAQSGTLNVVNTDEQHDEKKLEKVLNDYNQKKDPNLDPEVVKDITDEELTEEELKEFDQFANDIKANAAKLKDLPAYKKAPVPQNIEGKKLSENIGFMLEPLKKLSDQELESMLRERIKEAGAEKVYAFEPRIYPFTVKLIKDKEAIPFLISITEDVPRLTKLFWTIIATFIIGYFFKRITTNKDQPFMTSLFFGIVRMSVMFFLRVYVVWWFFEKELTPTYRIFKEVFFS